MDVLKALSVLAESGIELTEEQANALATFKSETMKSEAAKVFERKLFDPSKKNIDKWVALSHKFAADVNDGIIGANANRGRGVVHERMFRVDTEFGSLKVSLTTEAE